jgi:hypothetical protein
MPHRALTGVVLLIVTAVEVFRFRSWNFDDAFILFRIVRNLLAGHGWTFNTGEIHNASTSVLNTVATTAAAAAIGDIPLAAHLLQGVWLLLTGLLVSELFAERFSRATGLAAGIAMIVLLAERPTWGLETSLFVFLLTLVVYLEHRGRNAWLALGLLTLTRPDGLLMAAMHWVRRFATDRSLSWKGLALFALVLSPWVIFSLIQFHQVFPDTLGNKLWQGRSGFWGPGLVYLNGWMSHVVFAGFPRIIVFALAIPGLYLLVRDRSVLRSFVAFAVLQQLVYVVLNVPAYHWYFAIFDAAMLLAASYGVGSVLARQSPRVERMAHGAVLAGTVVFLGIQTTRLAIDDRNESYRRIASDLKSTGRAIGTVAAAEVGTIGYYLEAHRILDLLGLTTPNPEFATGAHNDLFFSTLPQTVLMRQPIWHVERAVHDDVRFEMLYGAGTPIPDPHYPMMLFTLKPGARPPSREDVSRYVEATHPAYQLDTRPEIATLRPSADAMCILDTVNGLRPGAAPMDARQMELMDSAGWTVETAVARSVPPAEEVYVLLTSGGRRYSARASRVRRDDVAAHLKKPELAMAGFSSRALLVNVPVGTYQIGVAQRQGSGFLYCEFPSTINVALSGGARP